MRFEDDQTTPPADAPAETPAVEETPTEEAPKEVAE